MARYTFEFGQGIDKALAELASEKGTTKADIMRRALASYSYLEKETRENDKRVSITNEEGRILKDVILP